MISRSRIIYVVIFISILGMGIFLQGTAEGSTPYYRFNFRECVDMALKNNNEIRASEYNIKLSESKLLEAKRRGIPVIKYEHRVAPAPEDIDDPAGSFFSGDITIFNNFKIEVGAPITTFGKIKTAQELGALGIDASWFQRQQKADEIVFKIYQIYQGILLARELKSLAHEAQNAIRGKITELKKGRVIDQLGILKMKVALYEIERKLEEILKKEKLALSALKLQMGLEDDVNFNIKDKALIPNRFSLKKISYYIEEARKYRPEYKLLETGVKAKEKQLKLEKLDPVPNLGWGGFADVGYAPNLRGGEDENNFTNPFNFTRAGVGISLKGKFDYVKHRSKVKQAEADLLQVIYKKRAAVRGLELDIQDTYLKLKEARNLMIRAGEEKKAARQMVFLTKSNLDIGIGERKEYLDSLQAYLVFQGRQYEAIFKYNVAINELKKKTGTLYDEQRKELMR